MTKQTKARLGALLVLFGASLAVPAYGQSGGDPYAGDSTDPVSGYPCVTPFCDTVRLPNTDCLCQKQNPNEERLERLRFICVDMSTRAQCSAEPR